MDRKLGLQESVLHKISLLGFDTRFSLLNLLQTEKVLARDV
jgi:hypothetical protein